MVLIQNTFEGLGLEEGSRVVIRGGVLSISAATRAHAGKYVCNATNSFGSDTMEVISSWDLSPFKFQAVITSLLFQVLLSVRSRLGLEILPEKLTVDSGATADLSCLSSDEGTEIEWLKDGVPLRAGNLASRVRFVGRNRITIFGVVKEDQGKGWIS